MGFIRSSIILPKAEFNIGFPLVELYIGIHKVEYNVGTCLRLTMCVLRSIFTLELTRSTLTLVKFYIGINKLEF